MFVFKTKVGANQIIKLTENSFVEATRKQPPFYQTINGQARHYAVCPACDNPISIVNLHVDKNIEDENKRKVTLHARHLKSDVIGLADYEQEAYDGCPYANPSSTITSIKRPKSKITNEILSWVVSFPDALEIVFKRDIGFALPESIFRKMMCKFKDEEGHLYRYVSKVNLPYTFAYMSNNQNLRDAKIDLFSEQGREIKKAIDNQSNFS